MFIDDAGVPDVPVPVLELETCTDPPLDLSDFLPMLHKLARRAKGWKDLSPDDLVQAAVLTLLKRMAHTPLYRNAVGVGRLRWQAERAVRAAWLGWKPWPQLPNSNEDGAEADPLAALADASEETAERRRCAAERVARLLPCLPVRRRAIIAFRFGLADGVEHTIEETGRRFGISKERARQLVALALTRLRREAELGGDER